MNDDKYIVYKRDEWDAWLATGCQGQPPKPLEDAVVIRTRDIFAASGLSAYAHNIQTWCEIEAEMLKGTPRHQSPQRFNRLDQARWIADYFSERAYEASARDDSKFPD